MNEKKLFLLDAYALIYRAYYALMRSPRVTSYGLNTSAIFGFCLTLDEVLRKNEPDYIAVCFDPSGGKTFRHETYTEYKAGRDKQPEDITAAIPYIKDILKALRIPVVEVPNYEADDVIGTLSRLAQQQGYTTYMMTLDKDYGQLVTEKVLMYRPALKGQGFEIRGPQEICERYGISTPSQVIDLLALEGDASDNVPGCPGVGEKTAAKLIAEWGSVENLLEHIGDLKGALKMKVENNIEQIRLSKYLVTINTSVPGVELDEESFKRHKPDAVALVEIFDKLEFKTMASKFGVSATTPAVKAPEPVKADDGMGSLFDFMDEDESKPTVTESEGRTAVIAKAELIESEEDIKAFVQDVVTSGATLGMALYSVGAEAMTAQCYGIALSTLTSAVYVSLSQMSAGQRVSELLQPLFTSDRVTLVGVDIKRDMLILQRENIDISNTTYFDISVAHYLIAPEMKHDIPTLAMSYLGYKTSDYEMSALERKRERVYTPEDAAAHFGEIASLVVALKPLLEREAEAKGQTELLNDVELPFVSVLARMEKEGVRIDVNELRRLSVELTSRLYELEQETYRLAGKTFNIASPMQVGEVLFEDLKIDPKAKKTKRGAWSTTEEILEKYRDTHPIVQYILDIRGLKKLLATYVDALPKLINSTTGKIHTTFNQTVTATGRISSANPNLQNIPIRTADGREIRRAFVPEVGDKLLSADYSQIELRLMAHISGDESMIEAFRSGEDIHRATAAKIFHEPLSEVSDDQRRAAKTANFGIIYGISAFGLAERLSIPRAEAKALIEGYLSTYSGVSRYMADAIERAKTDGFVSTIMGRKRYLPDINSRNSVVRGYAERNAINAPLQGSAADIIKIAMINIDREIRRRNLRSRMILQVHDELVFNVKVDELEELQELVVRQMESAYVAQVPLDVSVGVGQNWLEAH